MRKLFLFSLVAMLSQSAQARLTVGATTADVAAIVRAVGGDQVEVFSVAKGTQDPHQIEAKPSFMVKFRSADLIVAQGLELETAWVVPLIRGSRNSKISAGTKGYLELGSLVDPIEVAKGGISRSAGDVHPEGNPHFQLDPIRVGRSAVIVAERLAELESANRELFLNNATRLQKQLEEKTKQWKTRIEKTGIKEFVSYHKTLAYFADRFELKNTLQLEPKPGIPPTAGHIIDIINEMKRRNVKLVLIENYFDDTVKSKLQSEMPDVRVVKVPVAVGGEDSVKTSEDLIEFLVKALEAGAR